MNIFKIDWLVKKNTIYRVMIPNVFPHPMYQETTGDLSQIIIHILLKYLKNINILKVIFIFIIIS